MYLLESIDLRNKEMYGLGMQSKHQDKKKKRCERQKNPTKGFFGIITMLIG